MDGWMDGWVDGWMDGRTDGQMDGWMDDYTLFTKRNDKYLFSLPSNNKLEARSLQGLH